MTEARSNNSRSKEFDIIFCYLRTPQILLDLIQSNPNGGIYEVDGIKIEYGGIARLVSSIEIANVDQPFDISPVYIAHVDHLSKARKLKIEAEFNLIEGSISDQNSKVDILIIDSNNKPYYISFKDADSVTKLGQKSGEVLYKTAKLKGGLDLALPANSVPAVGQILWNQTALKESQFEKLNAKDKEFAYYKNHFNVAWQKTVTGEMNKSKTQLIAFGQALKQDNNSLIDFIGQTFAGNLILSPDFYILLGSKPIFFKNILNKITEMNPEVITEEFNTPNKFSLIIGLKINCSKYYLTKIETAFDGADKKVSQTKGVIFYFQQYPNSSDGNHFKKLFIDIAKKEAVTY